MTTKKKATSKKTAGKKNTIGEIAKAADSAIANLAKAAPKPRPVAPTGPAIDSEEKAGAATIKLVEPYLEKFNKVKANMERLVPGLKADKTTVIYNALFLACDQIDAKAEAEALLAATVKAKAAGGTKAGQTKARGAKK